nr:MAG: hypothetical protein DIU72_06860 [Pseudomonadota bacterium]
MYRMRILLTFLFALAFSLPALARADVGCVAGDAAGIDPVDVETVAQIVCSQLRRQGVQVSEARGSEGEHWRVNLRPLGRKVILTLQHVGADGVIRREGELMLNEIEEAPVGAPRLVTSVLEDRDISSTATVATLVGDEVRTQRKKDGEHLFGLGLLTISVPGTDVFAGGGLALRWAFETPNLGVLADLRFAGGSPADDDAGMFGIGVGGRWFTSPGSWSPFVGAGLQYTVLSVTERGKFSGSQNGMGAWLEIGVELLRLYESRLSFELRAEPAFFELEEDDDWFEEDDRDPRRRYYVPITFGITYLF